MWQMWNPMCCTISVWTSLDSLAVIHFGGEATMSPFIDAAAINSPASLRESAEWCHNDVTMMSQWCHNDIIMMSHVQSTHVKNEKFLSTRRKTRTLQALHADAKVIHAISLWPTTCYVSSDWFNAFTGMMHQVYKSRLQSARNPRSSLSSHLCVDYRRFLPMSMTIRSCEPPEYLIYL